MKLDPEQRQFARLAAIIHGRLAARQGSLAGLDALERHWIRARGELRRLRHAQRRGWRHAQDDIQVRLQLSLGCLQGEIQQLLPQLRQLEPTSPSSAHDIYRDLLALREEFDAFVWSKKHNKLSVTTEPITLEGRYFGPFRIELDIRQFCPQPSYSVIAEDPQPAGGDSDVTHPHVQGDHLCEGEGTMPIRAALREGRLLDFFLIVNNLLHTYNASGPYVAINHWDGVNCADCGCGLDQDDDSYSCARCNRDMCDDCSRSCCGCGDGMCSRCSTTCQGCEDDLCRGCEQSCRDCSESFCSQCLFDDERCPSCHERYQAEQEELETERADAALLPVCMGEAVVHAGSG